MRWTTTASRLGGLFWRLNKGDVSDDVIAQLGTLCGALDERNYPHAQQIQAGSFTCLDPAPRQADVCCTACPVMSICTQCMASELVAPRRYE